MQRFTLDISEKQMERLHRGVSSDLSTAKNHLVMYVKQRNQEKMDEMVATIEALQALYSATNVKSRRETAEYTGRPIETNIYVDEKRD